MAHKMAHTANALAWRHPGAPTPELWRRRNLFLHAAEDFAPAMLEEYQVLRPVGRSAAQALASIRGADYLDWWDILEHSEAPGVAEFRRALQAWAEHWHLGPAEGSGDTSSWVFEATTEVLCNGLPDHPYPLRVPSYAWTPPIRVPMAPFEVIEWSAGEKAHIWRKRWQARFKAHLDAHIKECLNQLREMDLEAIPRQRSEQDGHVERAARWQVGGEEWTEFLGREGLLPLGNVDRGAKLSNVRDKILGALTFVGMQLGPSSSLCVT